MLTAVQSLRLLVWRGGAEGDLGVPGLVGRGLEGAAGGLRYAPVGYRASLRDGVWWVFHRGNRCGNVIMELRGDFCVGG